MNKYYSFWMDLLDANERKKEVFQIKREKDPFQILSVLMFLFCLLFIYAW